MNRLPIAACFLLVPFVASCALSEDETQPGGEPEIGAEADQSSSEEIAAADDVQPTTQSLFGDACTNTDIFITNSRTRNGIGTTIEVRRVEFYSASEGAWVGEDLTDRILNFGTTSTWWDEDLAGAENDLITKWRVYYRYVEYGTWSSVVYQEIDTPNETCIADSNFEMTVE